jgi:hypothetical protein
MFCPDSINIKVPQMEDLLKGKIAAEFEDCYRRKPEESCDWSADFLFFPEDNFSTFVPALYTLLKEVPKYFIKFTKFINKNKLLF